MRVSSPFNPRRWAALHLVVVAVLGPFAFAAVVVADPTRWASAATGLLAQVVAFFLLETGVRRVRGAAWYPVLLVGGQWVCIGSAVLTSIRWQSLQLLLAHLGVLGAIAMTNVRQTVARDNADAPRAGRAAIYVGVLACLFVLMSTVPRMPHHVGWIAFSAVFGSATWWLVSRAAPRSPGGGHR